jgi:nucleoside-diphosphate-sugar epimerase
VRVLLIGGSGFIGRRVIDRLQQRGHDVIVFHRGQTGKLPDRNAARITGNRLEIDQYVKPIKDARPDAAIDFLPWNDRDTRRVIDTLHGQVERVVHISSGDVYRAWGTFLNGGKAEPVPLAEEAPLRADRYPYAGTRPGMEDYDKILAERAIFKAHFEEGYPGIIVRLPMVYGPDDPQHRTWPIVKRILDGRRTILLSSSQSAWLWQRGYVDDVAFAIVLAAERANSVGQVYNVGSLQTLTIGAWVRNISEVMGWKGDIRLLPRHHIPEHLQTTYNYQQHILFSTTKIRRELGYYELIDAEEALRRTVEWQRDNPPAHFGDTEFDYEAEDAALRALERESISA